MLWNKNILKNELYRKTHLYSSIWIPRIRESEIFADTHFIFSLFVEKVKYLLTHFATLGNTCDSDVRLHSEKSWKNVSLNEN